MRDKRLKDVFVRKTKKSGDQMRSTVDRSTNRAWGRKNDLFGRSRSATSGRAGDNRDVEALPMIFLMVWEYCTDEILGSEDPIKRGISKHELLAFPKDVLSNDKARESPFINPGSCAEPAVQFRSISIAMWSSSPIHRTRLDAIP